MISHVHSVFTYLFWLKEKGERLRCFLGCNSLYRLSAVVFSSWKDFVCLTQGSSGSVVKLVGILCPGLAVHVVVSQRKEKQEEKSRGRSLKDLEEFLNCGRCNSSTCIIRVQVILRQARDLCLWHRKARIPGRSQQNVWEYLFGEKFQRRRILIVKGGVDDVDLVEMDSGDSEGELETVEPWALPDLSQVNRLAETKSWVQEVRFELPVGIPGIDKPLRI